MRISDGRQGSNVDPLKRTRVELDKANYEEREHKRIELIGRMPLEAPIIAPVTDSASKRTGAAVSELLAVAYAHGEERYVLEQPVKAEFIVYFQTVRPDKTESLVPVVLDVETNLSFSLNNDVFNMRIQAVKDMTEELRKLRQEVINNNRPWWKKLLGIN